MQRLQLDIALLPNFCQISSWIHIAALAICRDSLDTKMEMLTCGSCARIARHAKALTGKHSVALLDIDA